MSTPFRPATTKVGMRPTRLPAGAARDRLMRLAQRASEVLARVARDAAEPQRARATLLVQLADGAACAIVDLVAAELRASNAERSLAVSRELTRQLQERADKAEYALEVANARIFTLEKSLLSEFDESTVNRHTNPYLFPEGSKP